AFLIATLAGGVTTKFPVSIWPLIIGGLLVGFGTRLGSGCTSGHGVCGMSRLSPRSLVATALFMASGFVTVALLRLGGFL
ncbi:MAG: YeeE/YedE family protein, partial [Hyphomonadaceae bacterium]